ncbi:hypothetical protein [Candidatus Coxiella mudrowiae]|nr:hypothetical protein [Candidatus Coxiella mudrowiae]
MSFKTIKDAIEKLCTDNASSLKDYTAFRAVATATESPTAV